MIKFQFNARSSEQVILLEVSMPYRPGNQGQRARRLAVGELLAVLKATQAEVDAEGEDRVIVVTQGETWVIGEGGAAGQGRGRI
ncbi:MAG: hypothetical protein ACI9ON_004408 [Limisphaerales bacterium]|jgi:hypothetical protein